MSMKGWAILLAAAIVIPSLRARAEDASAKASDNDAIQLVEYFLKTETAQLAPDAVPAFMKVDPASLPENLRNPYLAKKEELLALQKIAAGTKKPPLRRLGAAEDAKCEVREGSDRQIKVMRGMGFEPIDESELMELMKKTSCSECELQTEFTLQILLLPPKKEGEKKRRTYMLLDKDPIWAVVLAMRQGDSGSTGTNFFGIGAFPKCR